MNNFSPHSKRVLLRSPRAHTNMTCVTFTKLLVFARATYCRCLPHISYMPVGTAAHFFYTRFLCVRQSFFMHTKIVWAELAYYHKKCTFLPFPHQGPLRRLFLYIHWRKYKTRLLDSFWVVRLRPPARIFLLVIIVLTSVAEKKNITQIKFTL